MQKLETKEWEAPLPILFLRPAAGAGGESGASVDRGGVGARRYRLSVLRGGPSRAQSLFQDIRRAYGNRQ